MFSSIVRDIRHALRAASRSPGFVFFAIITLAMGIGINTAIFSVVNGVLLRPPPYGDPDRIVKVYDAKPPGLQYGIAAPANFLDWKERNEAFESIAAIRYRTHNLTDQSDEPEKITGRAVSPDFFAVMQVDPLLGRTLSVGDDPPGRNRVVVLNHSLWRRRFGSQSDIIGRTIRLDDSSYTVVGVMPAGFDYPGGTQFWTPVVFTAEEREWRRSFFLQVVARLKPGLTIEQAQARVTTLASQLENEHPEDNEGRTINLVPLHVDQIKAVRSNLWMLFGAAGFVLLIACANVANLLLVRAAVRGKEFSIRSVLGAGRARLARQLLVESVLLGILGGVVGLVLAWGGVKLFLALSPANFPRLDEIGVDLSVLGYTMLISIVTGIAFGMLPALKSTRMDLSSSLKEGTRTGGGELGSRFRNVLVVSEIALAMVLLVGAGLLVRSFLRLTGEEIGFDPERLIALQVSLPAYKYPDRVQQLQFFEDLIERARSLPDVRSVSAVNSPPFSDWYLDNSFSLEERDEEGKRLTGSAGFRIAAPGYFRTMGMRLLRGRTFSQEDLQGAPGVLVVNEALVKEYFPNEDPLGKKLAVHQAPTGWRTIVGVVNNVKHEALGDEPKPEIFRVMAQSAREDMMLVVRAGGDPSVLIEPLRSQVYSLDPQQPISRISTMETFIADSVAQPRMYTYLLSIFAGAAVLLAAVGIYGVIAYSVSQRTHEIGIRMALGAQRLDLVGLVVRQGLVMAVPGVALGLFGSYALTRYLQSLLYEVAPTDFLTFGGITLLVILVSVVAGYVPARRSTRVDPLVALRAE